MVPTWPSSRGMRTVTLLAWLAAAATASDILYDPTKHFINTYPGNNVCPSARTPGTLLLMRARALR